MTGRAGFSLLAWAGWQLQMPDDWRPLKLSGTPAKGWMMVGDAECAMFSIHWERPKAGALLDGQSWVAGRLRRHGVLPDGAPPAAEYFSACSWARGVQTEEDKQTTYWYGYAAPAELLLGLKINGVLPQAQLAQVTKRVLPTLRTSPADAPSTWAMYDLSFVAPPGFQLEKRHLFAGDVALEFRRGRRESLMLRQVYPGDLALGRRSYERWLAAYPFKQHRRLRSSGQKVEPWQEGLRQGVTGMLRRGRKRLGFPLGGLAPRWTSALAVHDQRLNRLLIAEHMATEETDGSVCAEAIGGMNQPWQEGC